MALGQEERKQIMMWWGNMSPPLWYFSGAVASRLEELREHKGPRSFGWCEKVSRGTTGEINVLTKQDCAGRTGSVRFWQWIQ